MSNYGRNFGFRVPPWHGDRSGKHYAVAAIPEGAPVVYNNGAENALGLMPMALASAAAAKPLPGLGGIAVYEFAPNAFAGDDVYLTDYSDKGTIPLGAAIQVVRGMANKVWFRNTAASTFLGQRAYAGRVMVAGVGIATPTVAVGDMLTPGTGNDSAGYWAETSDTAKAWLIVTRVENARGEVEAKLNF